MDNQESLVLPSIQYENLTDTFEGDINIQYNVDNNIENNSYIGSDRFIKQTVAHPWMRYFARRIDEAIYLILWLAFAQILMRWNINSNTSSFINLLIALILMLFIEPILLSTFGTTFGKWIFGLKIRNIDSSKLSYKQALSRTCSVIRSGIGYGIPVYSLIRLYKSYEACKDNEPMPWEANLTYSIKIHKLSSSVFIVSSILLYTLIILIDWQALMPIHRGNITAVQYSENCNDYLSYNKVNLGKYMNEQGLWVDKQLDDTVYIPVSTLPIPNHELTITNGIVTGIKLEVETTSNEWIEDYILQKHLAIHSFLVAQSEMNCIEYYNNTIIDKLNNDFENYSFTESGVKVTNKVEYSGYEEGTDQILIPTEGKKQHFHMIFTLEKVK